MGALVGRVAGDPPLVSAARVLPLAAQQPVVAGGADDGTGRERAGDGRGGGGVRAPGPAPLREAAARGGRSGAGVRTAAATRARGPAPGPGARETHSRPRGGRVPAARRGRSYREAHGAAADIRAVRGGAVGLPAAAAPRLAPRKTATRQLAVKRLGWHLAGAHHRSAGRNGGRGEGVTPERRGGG